MLKIKPPDYKYCPFCGGKLGKKRVEDRERKYCKKDGWIYYPYSHIAVHAVITKDSNILLAKRSRKPHINKWQLPAGFVEYGEDLYEALVREVNEEIGLKVKSATLLQISQSDDDYRAPGHYRVFYKVTTTGEVENKDTEENSRIEWFNFDNIPQIAWKDHKNIIKKLQDGNL